jgi:poly(A) polymerase
MAHEIGQVSPERIRDELRRILTEGQAARGVQLLHNSGLLNAILPELEWNRHLDSSLRLLRPGVEGDFAFGVLFHEMKPGDVQTIVERLKFSRAEMHHIVALVENLPQFSRIQQMTVSALKRFFRLHRFEDHLELSRIHAVADAGSAEHYKFALLKYRQWSREEIAPRPFISGEDLITLGFKPGPLFREILTRVEDGQLEGDLQNWEDAMAFVKRTYGKGSS